MSVLQEVVKWQPDTPQTSTFTLNWSLTMSPTAAIHITNYHSRETLTMNHTPVYEMEGVLYTLIDEMGGLVPLT